MNKSTVNHIIASIALLLLVLISNADSQTEVFIQASKDNTLYESNTGALSNGNGAHFFVGKTGVSSIRRGLLEFDIAGNIESGASIDSATLTLSMSKTSTTISRVIALRKSLSNWGEGESNAPANEGAGTPAENGDATWVHTFYDTTFWTDNGGDFSNVVSATESVGGINSYTWNSTPELVADVQSWLDSPSTNYGWILIGDESERATSKRFDSRENDTVSNRPILRIIYGSVISVSTLGNELPDRYDLEQNYPNPFNPVTNISYSLPRSGNVTLIIYNILGGEVTRLVDEFQTAGEYSTGWNAINYSSGIYFYRLQSGDFRQTKKMVLLK